MSETCVLCGEQIIDEDIIDELYISNGFIGYYAGYICKKCTNHLDDEKLFERK